jgi:hypothetical protein
VASVPTPGDGFRGGVPTTSDLNSKLVDPLNFLLNPPIARLKPNTTQSTTSGTYAAVAFQVEEFDSVNGHDNASFNTRYTFVYPGKYEISAGVFFAGNATGRRGIRIVLNGTFVDASSVLLAATTASGVTLADSAELVSVAVGDYVEIQALQESGGALNISAVVGTEHNSRLNVRWVSL